MIEGNSFLVEIFHDRGNSFLVETFHDRGNSYLVDKYHDRWHSFLVETFHFMIGGIPSWWKHFMIEGIPSWWKHSRIKGIPFSSAFLGWTPSIGWDWLGNRLFWLFMIYIILSDYREISDLFTRSYLVLYTGWWVRFTGRVACHPMLPDGGSNLVCSIQSPARYPLRHSGEIIAISDQ